MLKIEDEYNKIQLEDEIIEIILHEYKKYVQLLNYESRSIPISKYNWIKCKFLISQLNSLSKSFHS